MTSPKLTNVTDLMNEALRNPDPSSRKLVLRALQKYFHKDGIFELVHYVSQRDADPEVRELAADLLDVVTIKLNRMALLDGVSASTGHSANKTGFFAKLWKRGK